MKKLMFLLMIALPLVASSCSETKATVTGNGRQVTENRNNLKDFETIEINGSFDVIYRQASTYHVSVRGPQKLVSKIETTVSDNRLKIGLKKSNTFNLINTGSDDVTIVVSSPDLTGVILKGSGDFKCNGHVDTDNMKIELRGSGEIEFKSLICDNIQVTLAGSGDIDLPHVTARRSDITLIGSGDIDITQHQVDLTNMELKGSGDIELKAVDCGTIESLLIGSGDINIEGTARQERHDVKGSGDVHTQKLLLK